MGGKTHTRTETQPLEPTEGSNGSPTPMPGESQHLQPVFSFLVPPETPWRAARFFRACSRSDKKNLELKKQFFWRSVKLFFGESVVLHCCAGVQLEIMTWWTAGNTC